ncbi:MAG: TRAP transporter substrate-binding protein [Desulfomonile tiedjei]|nr:TRAP transporter substrate-binding protein [Desulfomonile tiedjei]
MLKKRFRACVCGCLMVLLPIVMAAGPGYCATVTFTYSIFFPATHGQCILATEWAKEIEKRTNGAVKVNMFPGGTLTPADQCYDGIVKGISDIGMSVVSYVKGRFPLSEVIDLPLGYKKGNQATKLGNAYYAKFKPKEFDDVKIMYFHGHGPGLVNTKKPVYKLEDLKGMKLRCTGTSAKIASALGATPVAMAQNETYDALQKGVVDGVLSPIETLKGWKFAEVTSSTTQDFGASYSLLFFVAMNKKKWESLPKDVQATIEKINQEWIEKTAQLWVDVDEEGTKFALAKGHKIIPLSKEEDARWAEKVQPVLEEYVKDTKAKGLPGDEALKFCQEWLQKNP